MEFIPFLSMDDVCGVCLEPMLMDCSSGFLQPCYHRIHGNCVHKCILLTNRCQLAPAQCPYCRQPIHRFDAHELVHETLLRQALQLWSKRVRSGLVHVSVHSNYAIYIHTCMQDYEHTQPQVYKVARLSSHRRPSPYSPELNGNLLKHGI